jgi:hypothetical protein
MMKTTTFFVSVSRQTTGSLFGRQAILDAFLGRPTLDNSSNTQQQKVPRKMYVAANYLG